MNTDSLYGSGLMIKQAATVKKVASAVKNQAKYIQNRRVAGVLVQPKNADKNASSS